MSSQEQSGSCKTSCYRAILRSSRVALVISAILLAGTSLLLSRWSRDDQEPLSAAEDFTSSVKELRSSFFLLVQKEDNNHVEFTKEEKEEKDSAEYENSILDSTNETFLSLSSMEDLQRHRRLKRIVGRTGNERERKAEEAKARAQNMQPAVRKDYVSVVTNPQEETLEVLNPRYAQALQQFQDIIDRQRLDPLGGIFQPLTSKRVEFEPQVQYLGVLVDAGRHYFPIDWLKRLIVYLHRLRFNLIHFRLTDDQAFALQLESYPALAFPSVANIPQIVLSNPSETSTGRRLEDKTKPNFQVNVTKNVKTYTPQELRDLVAFAKAHGITMMPEVNVPGHAGAWAGIPDLVVNCPEFVCARGYGIPLNVEHPQLKTILKRIIGEVLDIFDNPPLLHLGGDELDMSSPCFKELHKKHFDYVKFETLLGEILGELNYSPDRVLRWEETALPTVKELMHPKPPRTGGIHHFWHYLPGKQPNKQVNWKGKAFFVSHEIYMDVNHESGAYDIYNSTRGNLQMEMGPEYYPTGMVAGTFELSTDFWMQRNVAARLIAVAMGAARLNFSSADQFWDAYNATCRDTLGLDASVCDLQGYIAVSHSQYRKDWSETWVNWTSAICDRMTEPKEELVMSSLETNFRTTFEEANKHFWRTLKKPLATRTNVRQKNQISEDRQGTKMETGVILDLVNAMRPTSRTLELLEAYMAPLGIDFVQIRLADNHGFAVGLEETTRVGYFPFATYSNPLPPIQDYANLVREAGEIGIELYPEITLSTNAGGWVGSSGFALNCPNTFCNDKKPYGTMATNIGRREFLPVVYSVIRELMDAFSTSRYIHLGSDERTKNLACFQEDGRYTDPPFNVFERDLNKLLKEYLGMTTNHILRWENEEQVHYPGRTGDITHYRATSPFVLPKVRSEEPFFVTIDLLAPMTADTSHSVFYEIYKNTRQLVKLQPEGVLAEIRNLDPVLWIQYFVGLRLIAFKIATRTDQEDLSAEEFQNLLVVECQRVQFEHCEKVSKGDYDMPSEKLTYIVEEDHFRRRICDKNTEIVTSRVAKEVIE
jgi:Glycosyl hydrolase family 20, catalytic domain